MPQPEVMQEPSYIGFHLNDDEDRIRVSSSLSPVICRTILVNNDATVKDLSQSLNLPRNQGSDLLSTFISRSCIISGSRSQKLQQKRTQHTIPREHPPSENIAQERDDALLHREYTSGRTRRSMVTSKIGRL